MERQHFVNLVDNFADLQRLDGINVFNELNPETAQQLFPFHFAGRDVIQIFFQLCRKVVFHILFEKVFQKDGHNAAAVFRNKTQFFNPNVFSFLQYRNNRSISGRTSDSQFFQFFHQTGFGKTRRRRSKVLFRRNFAFVDGFADGYVGQNAVFVIIVAVVFAFLIQLEKTVKFDYLAVGAQHNFGIGGNRVDDYFVQNRRVHLAGNGTFPYKLIQLISVSVEFCFHFLRRIHNVRGTDGFVRFLSVFRLGFIFFCRFGQVSFAKIFQNCISAGADGFLRQVDGIGTHISDVTVFIKFLCHLHGLLCRKAKFTGGFLLQSGGGKRRRRIAVGLFTLDIGDTKVLRLNFCFGF